MLTGVRAFSGQDVSETLAAVIRGEPDWHALTDETPASIRRLLRRCLAKDPKGRLSDASMARIEIDEALSGPQLDIPAAQTTSRRTGAVRMGIGVGARRGACGCASCLGASSRATRRRECASRSHAADDRSRVVGDFARRQRIVFVATSEGVPKLWLRSLDSDRAAPLAGTDGAMAPFWSPDSRTVGVLHLD